MFRRMRITRCVSLLTLLLFCGCSASDFKLPIDSFALATKAASDRFADFEKVVDQANHERKIGAAIRDKSTVSWVAGDCVGKDTKHCRLQVRLDSKLQPLKAEPLAPNMHKLMAAIVLYTETLKAIAAADTVGEVKTATEAAKTSVIGAAKAVDQLNAALKQPSKIESQITPFAAPVTELIVFGLTKYLEARKLEALRTATADMNIVFPAVAAAFGELAYTGWRLQGIDIKKKFDVAWNTYRVDPQTHEKVIALEVAAEAYDAWLSIDPRKVFDELREAHDKLTIALHSPDLSFDDLLKQIQNVANEIAQLAALKTALEKAAEVKH